MTFYQQLIRILKEGRQYGLLAYVPARDRRNLVRQADDVVDLLRRCGGEEALRLAKEIGQLRDRIEARDLARVQAWRAWRRGRRSE